MGILQNWTCDKFAVISAGHTDVTEFAGLHAHDSAALGDRVAIVIDRDPLVCLKAQGGRIMAAKYHTVRSANGRFGIDADGDDCGENDRENAGKLRSIISLKRWTARRGMSFVARRRPIGALKDALAKLAAIVPRSPCERQGEGIAVSLSGYLRQASQLADIRCKIGSRFFVWGHKS